MPAAPKAKAKAKGKAAPKAKAKGKAKSAPAAPKAAAKAKAKAKPVAAPNDGAPVYQPEEFKKLRGEFIAQYKEDYGSTHTNAAEAWKVSHLRNHLVMSLPPGERKRRRFVA